MSSADQLHTQEDRTMGRDKHEAERQQKSVDSLEQSDSAESLRQLWWTIGATVIGIAVIALLYL